MRPNWSVSRCNLCPLSSTRTWMRWPRVTRKVAAALKHCCWACTTSRWAMRMVAPKSYHFACPCWRRRRSITRRNHWMPAIYGAGRRTATKWLIGAHCHRWKRSTHRIAWKLWPHWCLSTINKSVLYTNRHCIICVASHRNWPIRAFPKSAMPTDRRMVAIRTAAWSANHRHASRCHRIFC